MLELRSQLQFQLQFQLELQLRLQPQLRPRLRREPGRSRERGRAARRSPPELCRSWPRRQPSPGLRRCHSHPIHTRCHRLEDHRNEGSWATGKEAACDCGAERGYHAERSAPMVASPSGATTGTTAHTNNCSVRDGCCAQSVQAPTVTMQHLDANTPLRNRALGCVSSI